MRRVLRQIDLGGWAVIFLIVGFLVFLVWH